MYHFRASTRDERKSMSVWSSTVFGNKFMPLQKVKCNGAVITVELL